jgi:hypothetical protein
MMPRRTCFSCLRLTLDVYSLMVDEAFLSGDQHTAAYAATEAHSYPISRREAIGRMVATVDSVAALGACPATRRNSGDADRTPEEGGSINNREARGRISHREARRAQTTYGDGSDVVFWRHRRS